MKKLFILLLCVGCSSAPPAKVIAAPRPDCPSLASTLPPCEDKVIVMDEKGATCPANTRATFPSPFGFFQPGKIVVLCQCK